MRRFHLASVLLVLVSAVPSWADNPNAVASKLADLGYFGKDDAKAAKAGQIDPGDLETAALRYIAFHGLTAPTVPNPVAIVEEHLNAGFPRCGVPDFSTAENAALCKWPHLDVRFWQNIKVSGLTDAQVADSWAKALQSWADVCGITPQLVAERARANVASTGGKIDGPGRTLAYAYLPCNASESEQLTQLYDNAERWTPAFLQEVMAHELGHSLGLSHSRAGNLMQPYATGQLIVPQAGDIVEAQNRYGTPKPKGPTPPTPPPNGPAALAIAGEIKINGSPYTLKPVGSPPDTSLGFFGRFGSWWAGLSAILAAVVGTLTLKVKEMRASQ